MNPKVSPSATNLPPHQGKKRVFRKPTTGISSHIKESGIPSHIKDGQKAPTANYDLSHLDVVPPAVKDTSVKTKHVHFLPEDTYISGRPTEVNCINGRPTEVKQAQSDTGHDVPKRTSAPPPGLHKAKKHNGGTSGRVRTNHQSQSAEVASVQSKLGKAFARRSSVNSQGDHHTVTVQRSNSLPAEHMKHCSRSDNDTRKHGCKQHSPKTRTKEKRSLPATPSTTSATSTGPTMNPTQDNNNIQLVVSQKEANLSVNFNNSHLNSPTPKNNISSNTIVTSHSTFHQQTARSSSNRELRQETGGSAESQAPQPKDTVPDYNTTVSYKRNNSLSPPTRLKSSKARNVAGGTVTSTLANGNISNDCSPTKHSNRWQGTSESASNRHNGRGTQLEHRERFANIETKNSTNPGSPAKLHSGSLKHLDQAVTGYRCRYVAGIPSLLTSSSPSPSSISLSKEFLPVNVYSLSPTPLTKKSHSRKLTADQQLLFPFSDSSSSSLSVSSSLSTSSSHTRSRRSPSYFGGDCVFGSSLDFSTSTDLAQKDSQQFQSLSPASAGKNRNAGLSDVRAISNFIFDTAPLYDNSIPFNDMNHDHRLAKAKKQSIAASYHLDYCWFCGRPMPAFGTSLSGDLEKVDKLADLERRLAEALSEKVKLVEEQDRLKHSEMLARQQSQELQRELQEIKQKEKSLQEVPVIDAPSTPRKDIDLHAYIESLGHQLDICQHVLVTRHCCRGFLHKMGSHFNIWQKRWFVFDTAKKLVSYFTDKLERKPRGTLCFQTVQEVYLDHPRTVKSPDPKLTFCMKTYHRTYYLMAPSAVAMAIWIDVLLSGAEGYKGCYES